MNTLHNSKWTIEVDREKTKAYYDAASLITESCSCTYCNNWVQNCSSLPTEILELFDSLGINPTKEGEVFEICRNDNGTHSYGGFFHFVGRISVSERDSQTKPDFVEYGNGFSISFTNDVSLVPKEFPVPIAQIDIQGDIPWICLETPEDAIKDKDNKKWWEVWK